MTIDLTINTYAVFLICLLGSVFMIHFLKKYERGAEYLKERDPFEYGKWSVHHSNYELLAMFFVSMTLLSGVISIVYLISGDCLSWDYNGC